MPPAAFTPSFFAATVRLIRATSATVAPPGPKPVDVFTKSAPAFMLNSQPRIFSSSFEQRRLEDHLADRPAVPAGLDDRPDVLRAPAASSRPLSAPMLITMSISRAPSRIARRASSALVSGGCAPSGKPTTQHTFTGVPRSSAAAWRT